MLLRAFCIPVPRRLPHSTMSLEILTLTPHTGHLTPPPSRPPRHVICTLPCHSGIGILADTPRVLRAPLRISRTASTRRQRAPPTRASSPRLLRLSRRAWRRSTRSSRRWVARILTLWISFALTRCHDSEDRTHHGRRCGRRTPRADHDQHRAAPRDGFRPGRRPRCASPVAGSPGWARTRGKWSEMRDQG